MSSEKKDLILEQDIKEFVKKKLRDVKSVDDIFAIQKFKMKLPQRGQSDELYNQLGRYKKLLQLTINTNNNFEIFKKLRVKFGSSDDRPLSFYNASSDDGLQSCSAPSNEGDVVEALYNYIHCFLSLGREEPITTRPGQLAGRPDMKCSYCDSEIEAGATVCKVCNADVGEMTATSASNENKNEGYGARTAYGASGTENLNTSVAREEKGEREGSDGVQLSSPMEINSETERNWKCGKCLSANGYKSLYCDQCEASYAEGSWWCVGCHDENSGTVNECHNCTLRNAYAKAEIASRTSEVRREEKENIDLVKAEERRKIQRENSWERNAVPQGASNEMKGEAESKWTCGKCGFHNGYDLECCHVCDASYADGKWVCKVCTLENSGTENFCSVCSKRNDSVKGDGVQTPAGGGECSDGGDLGDGCVAPDGGRQSRDWVDKWRCSGCSYLNGYTFASCEVCCGLYKEGRWLCGGCKEENGGGVEVCASCHMRNDNLKKNQREDNLGHATFGAEDGADWGECWRCDKCRVLQKYEANTCGFCETWTSRTWDGSWKCRPCGVIIKCSMPKCYKCQKTNGNLAKIYQCCECKKEVDYYGERCADCRSRAFRVKWWCHRCSPIERNNDTDRYCYKCGFRRDYGYSRGASVERSINGTLSSVWVCSKCKKVIESPQWVCTGCQETRYFQTYCYTCNKQSSGRTKDSCDSCGRVC